MDPHLGGPGIKDFVKAILRSIGKVAPERKNARCFSTSPWILSFVHSIQPHPSLLVFFYILCDPKHCLLIKICVYAESHVLINPYQRILHTCGFPIIIIGVKLANLDLLSNKAVPGYDHFQPFIYR